MSLPPIATISSVTSASRSMPFCQVSRLMTQKIGPLPCSSPKRSSSARRLAVRCFNAVALKCRAISGSLAGFQTSASMPLTMPERSETLLLSRPSRPMPNSGVRISCA
ncbi:hypothetical protein D9M72_577080 [compost metagenome]